MVFETIDNVVRGQLVAEGLTIHWYFEFLYHALECCRNLNLEIFGNTKAVILPVNSYYAVDLPCDYVDYVKVGRINGQYVIPLYERDELNNVVNQDANGNPIPWPTAGTYSGTTYPVSTGEIFNIYYWWYVSVNDKGENLGGFFGYRDGNMIGGFKVVKSRNQIQLDNDPSLTQIYLEYITDNFSEGASNIQSLVPLHVVSCIRAYIHYKYLEGSSKATIGKLQLAKMQYEEEYRKVRAFRYPVSVEMVKKAFRRNYTLAPKM